MSKLINFTRFFDNVKQCGDLSWQEKAILSEVISYQLDEKPFKLKDLTLAYELAMDKGTVSKLVNRMYRKGIIDKNTVTYPSHSGGKPKRLRTVTVIDIDKWTTAHHVPVIKLETKAVVNDAPLTKVTETQVTKDTPSTPSKTTVDIIYPTEKQPEVKNNGLPIGFKKPLAKNPNEPDSEYEIRLKFYTDKGKIAECLKPTAKDFTDFAKCVDSIGCFDEKFIPIIWNRLDGYEKKRVDPEIRAKVEKYLQ